jgi:hypothetical protein
VALFRVGDRVAHSERPDEVGTVVAVADDDPAEAVYEIAWDSPPSRIGEAVLMRADA